MPRSAVLLALVLALTIDADDRIPLPQVAPALEQRLVAHLMSEALPPAEYVVSKFRDHDVVFVGEWHRIKHDVELIHDLIPLLHRSGVRTLGFEFARREDQPLIDKLLRARRWNEALAREIQFRSFPVWGYQEYVDVYRAAWRLNRSLTRRDPKFRILALGDSPDWSLIRTPQDEDDPEIRQKVWRGGGEHLWAQVILDEVARGEKVLVYSGIHHAFTAYKQPIVRNGRLEGKNDSRAGNHVFHAIGKRAFTIYLHAPWHGLESYDAPMTYPADGIIDAVMRQVPPAKRHAGFDTAGTPFGDLPGQAAIYSHGYENFRLADFCDGYIIQGTLSETAGVTPIPNFINAGNLRRAQFGVPNPRARNRPPEHFMESIASDANIPRRWRHLH